MKHYRIIFADVAESDAQKIRDYIFVEIGNQYAALRFIDLVEKKARELKTMPKLYPLVRDAYLAGVGFRSALVGNYAMFYRVKDDVSEVVIERVLHKKRDWVRILGSEAGKWVHEDDGLKSIEEAFEQFEIKAMVESRLANYDAKSTVSWENVKEDV